MKFQTFPATEFGAGHGSVRLVSSDSFVTGNQSSGTAGSSAGTTPNSVFTGQATNSAYFYDVRVTLDRLALKHVPHDMRVVPGIRIEPDINVCERAVWAYVLERVMPIVQDGMREPS